MSFSESFILVSKMKGCVVSCCYHKKWYWNQNNWKIQLIHLDYYSDVFPKSRYPSYKLEIRLLFWLSRFQSLCLKTNTLCFFAGQQQPKSKLSNSFELLQGSIANI